MTRGRLIALIVTAAVVAVAAIVHGLSRVGDNRGYEPDQPIAFSHKIHAGENGIACLYCHFGAEQSRHAGIPPAAVCMNCHGNILKDSPEIAKVREALAEGKPIAWTKVHRMADFVYFNHAQHVAVGGVPCQDCHGKVETMTRMRQSAPLTMGWCLDCHERTDVVVDGEAMKLDEHGGTDCVRCHY